MTVDTAPQPDPYAPDLFERVLAYGAMLLIVLVTVALFKGRAEWDRADPLVWVHLGTVMTPLILTPVQLLRRRGDHWHRVLGWIWAVLMFTTALVSFAIPWPHHRGLNVIHIFSVITVVTVPMLVLAARNDRIAKHRGTVRGLITGALLIAGYFTLLPTRMLGHWLWG